MLSKLHIFWRIFLVFNFSIITTVGLAGTFLDDFNDGDYDGWKRSPQNEKSNVSWTVVKGELKFDPKNLPWDQAISQLNFVGNQKVSNVKDWTDYDLEVDIKHTELANWPGGIRARVDLDVGGHYAVWLYPGDNSIKLYKNPGWDINTGLVTLGQNTYKAEVEKFHTVKLSCQGDTIKVFYDGKELISAKDSEHKKGTIALCVQDKIVYFDNVKVTGPNIPNVNMSPVISKGKLAYVWGGIKNKI